MGREQHQAIIAAVAAITPGRVKSYGGVATAAGLQGRARLVGTVLRKNPDAADLPWYRVVHADGTLAFPAGSPQFERQCALLAAEGVPVVRGRVARTYFGDDDDLDAVLWGPS